MGAENYVEAFEGADGQWYLNLRDGDNHAVLSTSEGYTRADDALRAAENAYPGLRVVVVEAPENALD